jgi:ribosome biogenesis GTPase
VGRVASEHKDRYTIKNNEREYEGELIGSLRFNAESRYDLPAVGDWIAFSVYDDNKALIHAVYPRSSILERKAVGKSGQTQIIATNIDFGLIVQSVNRDFSLNRLERYLTICHAARIAPIIVLSKIDLIAPAEKDEILQQVNERIKNIPVIAISNLSGNGIETIKGKLIKGKTYCLLGSSGVGKSTLINTLTGTALMETDTISAGIDRGKHVTTHRELIVMENGIMIDNPGMREVGITSASDGLEMTFDEISTYARACRFSDCTHTSEIGCAVLQAVEDGEISLSAYDNFIKMEKERNFFESNALDRKQKEKSLGKMYKRVQEQRRKDKF